VRGDGTIDEDEREIVQQIGAWMSRNSEAIFGTRPWRVFGEGPTHVQGGMFGEQKAAEFTGEDIRFTKKGNVLFAIALGWPQSNTLTLKSLAAGTPGSVERVELLGSPAPLPFTRDSAGLKLTLPATLPGEHAFAFRILGQNLT
jgi:alpha-L-fucosidase